MNLAIFQFYLEVFPEIFYGIGEFLQDLRIVYIIHLLSINLMMPQVEEISLCQKFFYFKRG